MSEYDAFRVTALALIARKGANLVLMRADNSLDVIHDTDAGTGTPLYETMKAVAVPPGPSAVNRIGSLVGRNIVEFHIARLGTSMQPEPGDTAIWGGEDWTVIEQTTYDPAADGPIYTRVLAER
jgi:hypothetical protein